ncbi:MULTISPECIES: HAD-IA family hydrolase [unclassified Motilimonas]|uniref:HAD-IA family hydrolase n=1 Tax=unclassified Motilimonas TaxID=2643697 RepID=UPI001E60ACDB|nr:MULTISPECIES: HAD-IA family hydrolase [unclassified Motilimonas]MCE0557626.1 HAD-IA family hydrolase [Motilimonas sp. E26]MDO6526303.1 HAD-IA family hydrolase [Motilimonas sp. 1_MG-2023]
MMFKEEFFLFDLDGTLVNTTNVVETAWSEWCNRVNLNPAEVIACCHGVRGQDIIPRFLPNADLEAELSWLDARELELSTLCTEITGAKALLLALPRQNWAIVTSSSKQLALKKLQVCGLPIPELLVTAEQCHKGKPDPEPYLIAIDKLNTRAAQCIVFEDAAAGITSAVQAGCQVIRVGSPLIKDEHTVSQIKDYSGVFFNGLLNIKGNDKV